MACPTPTDPEQSCCAHHFLAGLQPIQNLDDLPEGITECVICTMAYGTATDEGPGELPVRLPFCGHVYGYECIKIWLSPERENNSCGHCRRVFFPKQDDSMDSYSDNSNFSDEEYSDDDLDELEGIGELIEIFEEPGQTVWREENETFEQREYALYNLLIRAGANLPRMTREVFGATHTRYTRPDQLFHDLRRRGAFNIPRLLTDATTRGRRPISELERDLTVNELLRQYAWVFRPRMRQGRGVDAPILESGWTVGTQFLASTDAEAYRGQIANERRQETSNLWEGRLRARSNTTQP